MTTRALAGDVDGRTARRDRNRIAVLDAALELFSEENLTPTPEQVADRSGVSLRSVYRYVANSDELIRAAIDRHLEKVAPLFAIGPLGQGILDERIDTFVTGRLRVYDAIAATARASRLRAPTSPIIRDQLDSGRRTLRRQLERQFEPELSALDPTSRRAVADAADALTQIETIDLYRLADRRSLGETHELLVLALTALLGGRAAPG